MIRYDAARPAAAGLPPAAILRQQQSSSMSTALTAWPVVSRAAWPSTESEPDPMPHLTDPEAVNVGLPARPDGARAGNHSNTPSGVEERA